MVSGNFGANFVIANVTSRPCKEVNVAENTRISELVLVLKVASFAPFEIDYCDAVVTRL